MTGRAQYPDRLRLNSQKRVRNGRAQARASDIAHSFRDTRLALGQEMPIEVRLDLRGRRGGAGGLNSRDFPGCPADMQIVQLHSN